MTNDQRNPNNEKVARLAGLRFRPLSFFRHSSFVIGHSDADTRRLIVNADDFGRSASINQAVIRAHREGILTSASLMLNEQAYEEAVALAREHPQLGVGLHL